MLEKKDRNNDAFSRWLKKKRNVNVSAIRSECFFEHEFLNKYKIIERKAKSRSVLSRSIKSQFDALSSFLPPADINDRNDRLQRKSMINIQKPEKLNPSIKLGNNRLRNASAIDVTVQIVDFDSVPYSLDGRHTPKNQGTDPHLTFKKCVDSHVAISVINGSSTSASANGSDRPAKTPIGKKSIYRMYKQQNQKIKGLDESSKPEVQF